MMFQHCGRMNDHAEHDFAARQRIVVEVCGCIDDPCTCPPVPSELQRTHPNARQKMRCPGKLKTEGAPANMPVEVNL